MGRLTLALREMQGRFKHMFAPGNEWLIRLFQEEVDREWDRLRKEAQG